MAWRRGGAWGVVAGLWRAFVGVLRALVLGLRGAWSVGAEKCSPGVRRGRWALACIRGSAKSLGLGAAWRSPGVCTAIFGVPWPRAIADGPSLCFRRVWGEGARVEIVCGVRVGAWEWVCCALIMFSAVVWGGRRCRDCLWGVGTASDSRMALAAARLN
ncbi:hypothetical protein HMPREF9004_1214 [Schaalia cardiffensis F0333]|uniref:Uncharacterized protein n=1 Tax=Schaalia cardiffensis F0333 TaxID=888050 RepID=N6X3C3_9ACTO|nr:hypothetical protein HMPREF9004_1214 [Schaalia cardiffensis F0333]